MGEEKTIVNETRATRRRRLGSCKRQPWKTYGRLTPRVYPKTPAIQLTV